MKGALAGALALGITAAISTPFLLRSRDSKEDLEEVVATHFAQEYSISNPGKGDPAISGLLRVSDNSPSIDLLTRLDPHQHNPEHIIEVRAHIEGPGCVTLAYTLKDEPDPQTRGTFTPNKNTSTYIVTDPGISLQGTVQVIEVRDNKYNPEGQNPARYILGIDPESEEAFQNLAKINRLVDLISGEEGQGNELDQFYSTVIGEIERRTGIPVEKISDAAEWIIEEKKKQVLRDIQERNQGKRVTCVREFVQEGINLRQTVTGRSTTFLLSDENGNPPTGTVDFHTNIQYTGTESNGGFATAPFTNVMRIYFDQEGPEATKTPKPKVLEEKVGQEYIIGPENIFGKWVSEKFWKNQMKRIRLDIGPDGVEVLKDRFNFNPSTLKVTSEDHRKRDQKRHAVEIIETTDNGLLKIDCEDSPFTVEAVHRVGKLTEMDNEFSFWQPSINVAYSMGNWSRDWKDPLNGRLSYGTIFLREGTAPRKGSIEEITGKWRKAKDRFIPAEGYGDELIILWAESLQITQGGINISYRDDTLFYEFIKDPEKIDNTSLLHTISEGNYQRFSATPSGEGTLIFDTSRGIFTYTREE